MKYTEAAKLKARIMEALEKSVDNLFEQIQANEQAQIVDNHIKNEKEKLKDKYPNWNNYSDLQPAYFDASIVLDFPKHHGTNGEGFIMFCNPTIELKDRHYLNPELHNFSHKMMSAKIREWDEEKQKRKDKEVATAKKVK